MCAHSFTELAFKIVEIWIRIRCGVPLADFRVSIRGVLGFGSILWGPVYALDALLFELLFLYYFMILCAWLKPVFLGLV